MTEAILTGRPRVNAIADIALNAAARFWFATAMLGQWAFFYYIAGFYGTSTLTGNLEIWNRLEVLGRTPYVPGDLTGNVAYAAHALGAGIIAFGGALQLIPGIRTRAPLFHRWNGRVFLVTVTALSLSGFYLVWVRGTSPSLVDAISTSFNGALILLFAFLTLKFALARKSAIHRRWAMRLYLVSNAQWFLRVGLFSYFIIMRALGVEASMSDPFLHFWTFGCYLVPLAVLELYFHARDKAGPAAPLATAGVLAALTLAMGTGILGFAMFSQAIVTGAPLPLAG